MRHVYTLSDLHINSEHGAGNLREGTERIQKEIEVTGHKSPPENQNV